MLPFSYNDQRWLTVLKEIILKSKTKIQQISNHLSVGGGDLQDSSFPATTVEKIFDPRTCLQKNVLKNVVEALFLCNPLRDGLIFKIHPLYPEVSVREYAVVPLW